MNLGDLDVDTLLIVTVAGTALLSMARWPIRPIPLVVRLLSVAGFAVAAAGRNATVADDARNAMVIAVAALIVGEVVVRLLDGAGRRGLFGLVIGGGAVAGAGFVDDVERAAGLTVAGAGVVILVALASRSTGVVAVPGILLLTVDGLAGYDHMALDTPWDRVGAGAAAVGVLAAIVGRVDPGDVDSDTAVGSFDGPRLALGAFAAALVLIAQDLPDLRAAGLLLAGGATIAAAAHHPVGLVALLPGAAAAAEAFGAADHPVHAAAGGAIVLLVITTSPTTALATGPSAVSIDPRRHWAVAAAVAFAAVPLWGWSEADVGPGYGAAVAAGAATVGVVAVLYGGLVVSSRGSSPQPNRGRGRSGLQERPDR